MFHVNAWCLVFAGPMCGVKLVFPGCKLDGKSIYELSDSENVNMSAGNFIILIKKGVPTIWLMLL